MNALISWYECNVMVMVLLGRLYFSLRLPDSLWGSGGYRRHGHLLVTSTQRFMWDVSSVEDVVLEHEKYIKSYREEPQTELCRVSEERAPIIIVVRDQEHLEHA